MTRLYVVSKDLATTPVVPIDLPQEPDHSPCLSFRLTTSEQQTFDTWEEAHFSSCSSKNQDHTKLAGARYSFQFTPFRQEVVGTARCLWCGQECVLTDDLVEEDNG